MNSKVLFTIIIVAILVGTGAAYIFYNTESDSSEGVTITNALGRTVTVLGDAEKFAAVV
jgi:hypothetical protein